MIEPSPGLIQSVVTSLDGRDSSLYTYLPYLLQDLWEIGASPDTIIGIIQRHTLVKSQDFKVLDLGCGKGAVSVKLAKKISARVHGIDAMPEFIQEAKIWAREYGVAEFCHFELGDIRCRVTELQDYDLAVLGSIGPVLGDVERTLRTAGACLKPGGHVILDDGYIPDDSQEHLPSVFRRSDTVRQIEAGAMKIIEEHILAPSYIADSNEYIFEKIRGRAMELVKKYPQKKALFEGYLLAQQQENDILENHMTCVTWLLRKLD